MNEVIKVAQKQRKAMLMYDMILEEIHICRLCMINTLLTFLKKIAATQQKN